MLKIRLTKYITSLSVPASFSEGLIDVLLSVVSTQFRNDLSELSFPV